MDYVPVRYGVAPIPPPAMPPPPDPAAAAGGAGGSEEEGEEEEEEEQEQEDEEGEEEEVKETDPVLEMEDGCLPTWRLPLVGLWHFWEHVVKQLQYGKDLIRNFVNQIP